MTPEYLETLEVLEVSQTLPKRKDGLMDTQLVTKQMHLHQWTDMVRALYIPRELIILHGRFDHPSRRN